MRARLGSLHQGGNFGGCWVRANAEFGKKKKRVTMNDIRSADAVSALSWENFGNKRDAQKSSRQNSLNPNPLEK